MTKLPCPNCEGRMRFIKRTVSVPYGNGEHFTVLSVRGCIHSVCGRCGMELSGHINELKHTRAVYQHIKKLYGKSTAKKFSAVNTWSVKRNAYGFFSRRPGYRSPALQGTSHHSIAENRAVHCPLPKQDGGSK